MIPTDELEDYPKRTSVRRTVPIVIGIAIVVAIGYGILRPAPSGDRVRASAPRFTLGYLDGSGELSSEDLKGHPVVLNFWASWCIPCREESPLLERKWQEYRDEGVRFVGVVVQDTPESALAFVRRFDLTYPMVFDPDRELARELGLVGLPQTFFLDETGRVVASSGGSTVLGAIEEDDLDRQIQALLEGS